MVSRQVERLVGVGLVAVLDPALLAERPLTLQSSQTRPPRRPSSSPQASHSPRPALGSPISAPSVQLSGAWRRRCSAWIARQSPGGPPWSAQKVAMSQPSGIQHHGRRMCQAM